MAVAFLCSCGQRQYVSAEMSGQTLTCANCGKTMSVPVMGVLVGAKAKPKAAAKNAGQAATPAPLMQAKQRPTSAAIPTSSSPARSSSHATTALVAVALLLLIGASGFVIWWMKQRAAESPQQIAQTNVVGRNEQEAVAPSIEVTQTPLPAEAKASKSNESPKPAEQQGKRSVAPTPPITPIEKPPPADPPKQKTPPSTAERKPANLIEPLRLMWKLAPGDHFFQELTVTQKPTFKVQGIAVASQLQYQIVSRFTVKDASADGSLIVEQKVVSAKLLFADELTKPAVTGAVAQLPGVTYTLHLSPKMDVTKFEGTVAGPKVGALQFDGGLGVQMTSLLDRDGWKELAQSTFFQMDEPLQSGARWSKPHTHNWGSLGAWSGKSHYAYAGQQDGYHKIAFGSQLTFKAAAASQLGLLTVQSADFKSPQSGGTLFFDAVKGKVVAAEERFRVTGVLNASLLGQNTPIEIDEDQHFLIRIHEKLGKE